MTIAPEMLEELDFPTPDPLIEIQRELARLTIAPSKALAVPVESFEERMLREYKRHQCEEIYRGFQRQQESLSYMLLGGVGHLGRYESCYCSPSRGMLLDLDSAFDLTYTPPLEKSLLLRALWMMTQAILLVAVISVVVCLVS